MILELPGHLIDLFMKWIQGPSFLMLKRVQEEAPVIAVDRDGVMIYIYDLFGLVVLTRNLREIGHTGGQDHH